MSSVRPAQPVCPVASPCILKRGFLIENLSFDGRLSGYMTPSRIAFTLLLALTLLLSSQPQSFAQTEKPFGLPFPDPPPPSTWLLGQGYGNTTGAYRQRKTTYAA